MGTELDEAEPGIVAPPAGGIAALGLTAVGLGVPAAEVAVRGSAKPAVEAWWEEAGPFPGPVARRAFGDVEDEPAETPRLDEMVGFSTLLETSTARPEMSVPRLPDVSGTNGALAGLEAAGFARTEADELTGEVATVALAGDWLTPDGPAMARGATRSPVFPEEAAGDCDTGCWPGSTARRLPDRLGCPPPQSETQGAALIGPVGDGPCRSPLVFP
jgi:hypothetical protein